MIKILAYGSLREKGEWFKDLIKSNYDIKCVRTTFIKGFAIYKLKIKDTENEFHNFVAAKISTNDTDGIMCDVIEVNLKCFSKIQDLIRLSDFKTYKIMINDEIHIIYLYEQTVNPKHKIPHGNYNIFLSDKKEELTCEV